MSPKVTQGGSAPRAFSITAAAASCLAFVVIGALQALYGPAIPAFRKDFGISPSAAGTALSLHFVGALFGVLLIFRARRRLSNRSVLAISYVLMGGGAVAFAFAPSWPLALAAALVLGLGFGGIDFGLNQMFAEGFGARSAAMLNVLNAHFGVGAVLGPALISWLSPARYAVAFTGCGLVSLSLVFFLRGVHDVRDSSAAPAAASGVALRRSLLLIAAFVLIYVLHVGIETGVGAWEPTHLEALGHSASRAAAATSLFWLMMTVGRFLVAPISLRWHADAIVTASFVGMMLFLALATVPGLAPFAYAGVGLAIAPIFPTGLAWLNRSVPGIASSGAYVIAASMVGGVAFPPVLGSVIEWLGVSYVPWVLFALAAISAATSVRLLQQTRERTRSVVVLQREVEVPPRAHAGRR